ncbi:beta-lactamase family protein [Sphingobacterium sp. SRCM116780]|uniref:serine hydrolase domain-containing protein n=1 Tax=Sphingobacterium sp. SRCM116780 TaxID=2907623 RepID=UPI001F266037|nr:serine hydrolase domain-containing protein [Sphingobacterium sp. SRCM116780]UIR57382.1 beta-lactamase family protein [Sphingobacterium sp. SRCM116780]
MKLTFTLFACICLFGLSTTTAQKKNDYAAKIDSIMMASDPIPFNGVVLIRKKGKTVYAKAKGFKNFEAKIPLKMDDQFEVMSNSKQVTAVLILKEVEKGNVDLQSPIKKYLPHLTQSWADSVTVHQLLNHTHGIVDTEQPLAFKPGSTFKYGNLSYILLGEIIERCTKKTYATVANDLFKTLKMNNTFCYQPDNKQRLVNGYMNTENTFKKVEKSFLNAALVPAAGIISTAFDLSIWNAALHKGKLLQSETYKQMTTASTQSQHDVFGKENRGFGYNIRIIKEAGFNYYGVTGLGDGFTCLNVYFPNSDVSLIILENQMPENSAYWSYKEAAIKNILLKSSILQ